MSSKNKLKKTHSNSRECDICVSLVGPVGCGKSALLVKYITHRFLGEYDPFYGWFQMKYTFHFISNNFIFLVLRGLLDQM